MRKYSMRLTAPLTGTGGLWLHDEALRKFLIPLSCSLPARDGQRRPYSDNENELTSDDTKILA
jgi:hypothetical protein